jgi:L-rhamnose mutarotase
MPDASIVVSRSSVPQPHAGIVPIEGQHFNTYSLFYPDGIVLMEEVDKFVWMLVDTENRKPLGVAVFTEMESFLIKELIANYTSHCPYENLYGVFYNKELDVARKELNMAINDHQWDGIMRPIRNVLSRARIKARYLRFEIRSILEVGYVLHLMKVDEK